MDLIQGKHFSIVDPKGVKTIIYQITKTDKKMANNKFRYTVEKLDDAEEIVGENTKKTFYIENLDNNSKQLAILSFGRGRVVINNALLDSDRIKISRKPMQFKLEPLRTQDEGVYKEVEYTPNLKRPMSIIDPDTVEEVKPKLYFDDRTNQVKGKCKLKSNKSYFVFEVREKDNNLNIVGGAPTFID